MLHLKNLDAYYGESRVISELNMHVEKGKIVCLIGRNGVGKSTTLKSIMGLVKTPAGKILLEDCEIQKLPTYARAKLGIGYVPQGRDIFPQMTVQENMELGLSVKSYAHANLSQNSSVPMQGGGIFGHGKGGKGKIPDYIYELFPILPKFAKRRGGDLSGGQQQQLAIARALVAEPKILILDEPTEGIQPSIIQDIGAAIRKINEWKGVTVFMVEQYLEFVMDISDYIYVMEKGSIVLKGETKDLETENIQKLMTS